MTKIQNGSEQSIEQRLENAVNFYLKGDLSAVKAICEEILVKHPNHEDALNLSAIIALNAKQFELAVDLIQKAINSDPNYAGYRINHGNALKGLGKLSEALLCYEKAIEIDPAHKDAHYNRGMVLEELKSYDEALTSYDKTIAIDGNHLDAYINRGNTLRKLRQLDEALTSYEKAIAINSASVKAHYNRGIVLAELRRFKEAIVCFDKAIVIRPDYAEAHYNRGLALLELNDYDEALASFDLAILVRPDYAEVHYNRANILHRKNLIEEALYSYNKAIQFNSNLIDAKWNYALCKLIKGDFADGWSEYECRWRRGVSDKAYPTMTVAQPLWHGQESLKGKTILLWAEQGLGDTIQFSRYAALVANQGARVVLQVQPPLLKLLSRLNGVAEVVAAGEPLPTFDYQCPLMSLPLAFRTDLNTIPPPSVDLTKNERKFLRWKTELGAKIKPRIGIVWSGSPDHHNDHFRSLRLSELIPYLTPNCSYFSLQKEIRNYDKLTLTQHNIIRDYSNDLTDFTGTAALCELMDVVISVDTSVAHLAGTLGKPTWILLPFAPDWRWLLERDDSPWYPSVKLYRQDKIGDWKNVLQKIETDLFLI